MRRLAALLIFPILANGAVGAADKLLFAADFSRSALADWQVAKGKWEVTGGELRGGAGDQEAVIVTGNREWRDYRLEARVQLISGSLGILVRYDEEACNGYMVGLDSDALRLWKAMGGRQTEVANNFDFRHTRGATYRIRVAVGGSIVRVWENGVLALSASEASLASGKAGLRTWYSEVRCHEFKVTVPSSAARRAVSFDRSKPIVVKENEIDLNFPDELALKIEKHDDEIAGVTAVARHNLLWRAPDVPIRPIFISSEGGALPYRRYRLTGAVQRGKDFVLSISLEGAGTPPDALEWVFRPQRVSYSGDSLAGFSYTSRFRSVRNKVRRVVEDSTWELGGRASGNEYVGACVNGPINAKFKDNEFFVPRFERNTMRAPFDYLHSSAKALVVFYEPLAIVNSSVSKARGEETINFHEEIVLGEQREFTTPEKFVIFYPSAPEGINGWTRVWDIVADRMRKACGLKAMQPLTSLDCGTDELVRRMWTDQPLTWQEIADTVIPKARELNYQQLFIGGIWTFKFDPNSEGALTLDPAEKFGGAAQLRYLCDKAHAAGMRILVWFPCGHFHKDSPLLKAHPEWLIGNRDGSAYGWGYPQLVCASFKTGYKEYALGKLKAVKNLGADGLWLDSMPWSAYMPINYTDPNPSPQVAEFVGFIRELQRMGYAPVLFEGMGQFLLSGHGAVDAGFAAENGEQYLYQSNFETVQPNKEKLYDELDYYRLVANKAPLTYYWTSIRDKEKLLNAIAQANRDYRLSLPYMVSRNVLPRGGGIEWSGAKGKVLFVFKPFAAPASALDITAGAEVRAGDILLPHHTYHLEKASPPSSDHGRRSRVPRVGVAHLLDGAESGTTAREVAVVPKELGVDVSMVFDHEVADSPWRSRGLDALVFAPYWNRSGDGGPGFVYCQEVRG